MAEPDLFRGRYRIPTARLQGYDYGQSGAYFVTICTAGRGPHFGEVAVPGGDWSAALVRPTLLGERVYTGWADIPQFAPFVTLDAFILMPDHLHGILLFDKKEGPKPPPAFENKFGPQHDNLAAVLRGFKAGVSSFAKAQGLVFAWQPRYHDRVVRSPDELTRIRHYIDTNPSRWQHEWDNGESLYR